jgi:hypothetical protein
MRCGEENCDEEEVVGHASKQQSKQSVQTLLHLPFNAIHTAHTLPSHAHRSHTMASVFIGDLDDIIGPSQSCVNPIFAGESTNKTQDGSPAEAAADRGKAKLTLEASWMEADDASTTIRPDLIKTKGPGSAATVSLNDCLACRYAHALPQPLRMSPFPLARLSALGTFINGSSTCLFRKRRLRHAA